MIIVTGGKGFIGKNYVNYLKKKRIKFIIVEKKDSIPKLTNKDTIIHLGATTDTTAGFFECLLNNTIYTILLFEKAKKANCKFIYASSAAVYGNKGKPLNYYASSKKLIDDYINERAVGLRFFNVFGLHEKHKGKMMSFISKLIQGQSDLFEGTQKYSRDYVYVLDVIQIIEFFRKNYVRGVYDVGTGKSVNYTELFKLFKRNPKIIPLPKGLVGKLQSYTKADLTKLKKAGYKRKFYSIKQALIDMGV